jgi:hypothetical protein
MQGLVYSGVLNERKRAGLWRVLRASNCIFVTVVVKQARGPKDENGYARLRRNRAPAEPMRPVPSKSRVLGSGVGTGDEIDPL